MMRSRQLVFAALFFVSGACGLIYEIVWSRLLVLVFGGTTFAITTTLSCFMAGLAIGSFLAGRLGHRVSNPARLYGLLEIGIGIYALLVPVMLDWALPFYRRLAEVSGESFFWLTAARVLVSGTILIVPTACMGATLPLLVGAFARREGETGGAVARLYGSNTLGAFAGCAAAGFLLLPALGLTRSIALAAALNVVAGLAAVVLAARMASGAAPAERRTARHHLRGAAASIAPGPALPPGALLWLYGLSGFAAMAYQVAWTRALILSMGASTYAFSAIVACFILGVALGSLALTPWMARIRNPLVAAAGLEAAIGLGALLVVPLFGEMPGLVHRLSVASDSTFGHVLLIEVLAVFGLLIVPTFCMGALMPVVCALYQTSRAMADASRGRRPAEAFSGRTVGAVYASNTVGTILGAAIAGFVLIPWPAVGMQRTIILASSVSAAIATVFLLGGTRRGARAYGAVTALWLAGAALVGVSGPWSRSVMVSGPYAGLEPSEREVVFYREGIDTTVAVTSRAEGELTLRVNGKPDASSGLGDMQTQHLLAHIPLLLQPDATEVCVIGLGAGVTAGAALAHPVEAVDVVEISSAVIEASELFAPHNGDALSDPRLTLHRADGRNFLLLGERAYDVIISEPSNPWMSGVANLFTQEFFEIARSRLKPGGLHGQWLHSYSMEPDDFAAVILSMDRVFEEVQLWETGLGDYVVLGSDSPIVLDMERLYLRVGSPAVHAALSSIYINDPLQIANYYVAGGRDLATWTELQEPLVDDQPDLEFSAPRYLGRNTEIAIEWALLEKAGRPPLSGRPEWLLNRQFLETTERRRQARSHLIDAKRALATGDYGRALENLPMVALHGRDDLRMFVMIRQGMETLRRHGRGSLPEGAVDEVHARVVGAAPAFRRFEQQVAGESVPLFWPLGKRLKPISDPDHRFMIREAERLARAGDDLNAMKTIRRAAARFPESLRAWGMVGAWTLNLHGAEAAIPFLLKAWMLRPSHPETNYHLARAYARRGDRERALTFLEAAVVGGLEDWGRVESTEEFRGLQSDPRFLRLHGGA